MLAVDREKTSAAAVPRSECKVAGRDEALLVRERQCHSVLERPERRSDSGEADDGIQDQIRLGGLEDVGQIATHLTVLDSEIRSELVERLGT